MFEILSNYSENMFSQIDDVDIFQVSSPIENIKNQICKWESKSRPFVYEECHLDLSRLYSWMLEQVLNYILNLPHGHNRKWHIWELFSVLPDWGISHESVVVH